MNEKPKVDQTEEITKTWKQGEKFEEEGYEDLGRTLQWNAIEMAKRLEQDARKKIADILFSIK